MTNPQSTKLLEIRQKIFTFLNLMWSANKPWQKRTHAHNSWKAKPTLGYNSPLVMPNTHTPAQLAHRDNVHKLIFYFLLTRFSLAQAKQGKVPPAANIRSFELPTTKPPNTSQTHKTSKILKHESLQIQKKLFNLAKKETNPSKYVSANIHPKWLAIVLNSLMFSSGPIHDITHEGHGK